MEDKSVERAGAIALNRIFSYEPAIAKAAAEKFGSCAALFTQGTELFNAYSKYRDKVNISALEEGLKELEWLQREGFSFISLFEEGYPQLLRECEDAPAGLYVRSSTPVEELFNRGPAISIVGTRDCSLYGEEWCRKIVATLSRSGQKTTIVSGLAIGIDVCSHLAALAYGLPTIAVIPTGINDVYPRRHSTVAAKIAAAPFSALVSDFPPGTSPLALNFLKRNRIIAGLAGTTVLVESRAKGGGTMTARLSAGYGRDVFTLPGRIEDPRSEGCNRLLREKIAEPIVDLECLCEDLGLEYVPGRKNDAAAAVRERFGGDPFEDSLVRVAEYVKVHRGVNKDELCAALAMDYGTISSLCGLLENEGIIEMDLLQRCIFRNGRK